MKLYYVRLGNHYAQDKPRVEEVDVKKYSGVVIKCIKNNGVYRTAWPGIFIIDPEHDDVTDRWAGPDIKKALKKVNKYRLKKGIRDFLD